MVISEGLISELAEPAGLVCCPARHVLFLCYVRASVLSRSAAARVEYSSFSSARHWATSAAMRCATSASETPRPVSAAVQQVSANEPRIPSVKFTTSTDHPRGSSPVILSRSGWYRPVLYCCLAPVLSIVVTPGKLQYPEQAPAPVHCPSIRPLPSDTGGQVQVGSRVGHDILLYQFITHSVPIPHCCLRHWDPV